MMLLYSLETEKEVSINNDVQREARFIMEMDGLELSKY